MLSWSMTELARRNNPGLAKLEFKKARHLPITNTAMRPPGGTCNGPVKIASESLTCKTGTCNWVAQQKTSEVLTNKKIDTTIKSSERPAPLRRRIFRGVQHRIAKSRREHSLYSSSKTPFDIPGVWHAS